MSKYLKRLAMILLATVLSISLLAGPVFAVPNDTDTTDTQDITEVDPNTNPTDDQDTEEETTTDQPTCYDEVGGIGWLICPGTSFLANIIDGAYAILENLVAVNPISQEDNSPVHVVWDYLRNIGNMIFVIVFLIIIYSQLTGFGINNYGIKKMLPRLIIAAILMNLSFLVCSLAVDLSNIIGFALRSVFENIATTALENGTIGEAAQSISVGGIVSTILGVGVGGGIVALSVSGGFTGLIWLLIPVVLSGAIAIISALVTMAARQALVILLVMISPLAIAAYLLPNTERWFKQWYKLLISMLVFFPMFSILYGASNLAGLVMISSASNWLGVILGIAVMILPLFMSIPLLRMSGTMLGRVDGLVRGAGRPAQGALGRYAGSQRMRARNNYLNSTSTRPSVRLAKWLEQGRHNRARDIQEGENVLRNSLEEGYRGAHYDRRGRLNRRGERYYSSQARIMNARNAIEKFDIDMDEGFDENDERIRTRSADRIAATNAYYSKAITDTAINASRKRVVNMDNLRRRADTIQNGLKDADSEISRQVADSFNYKHQTQMQVASMSDNNRAAYNATVSKATNAILADAIAAKRKVDSEAKSNYLELYNDSPPGSMVKEQLEKAITDSDYNSMDAAIQVIRQRGDFDVIEDVVKRRSAELYGNQIMQKHLSEALLGIKTDDNLLAAYSTAIMKRRGMNGNGAQIAEFIDYDSFLRGVQLEGDSDSAYAKVSRDFLMKASANHAYTESQDKNTYKAILQYQMDGTFGARDMAFEGRDMVKAIYSGKQGGEALAALLNLVTGGANSSKASEQQFFEAHKAEIHDYLVNTVLKNTTANNLTSAKSDIIVDFNKTLVKIDPANTETITYDGDTIVVSKELREILKDKIDALNRPNAVGMRSGMSGKVREILGVHQN